MWRGVRAVVFGAGRGKEPIRGGAERRGCPFGGRYVGAQVARQMYNVHV